MSNFELHIESPAIFTVSVDLGSDDEPNPFSLSLDSSSITMFTLSIGEFNQGGGGGGIPGATGPQGPPGPPGPPGADGAPGIQGPPGTNGTNGTNGINGAPGVNGINGATGPAGPPGPAGQTTRISTATLTLGVGSRVFPYTETASNIGWAVGTRLRAFLEPGRYLEGIISAVSPTSVTLISDYFIGSGNGSNWTLSIAGDRGTNGANGTNGADGATGAMGPPGPAGPTGPAGATGPQGPQGEPGETGPEGPQGPIGEVDLALLDQYQTLVQKGVPDGYASLNSSGKVPASQLPTSSGDIIEYANLSLFPVTGEIGTIYIALDTDTSYIWDDDTNTYTPQTTVGSLPSNVGFKVPCRLVATSNIDIGVGGFPTIDGRATANNYRILLTGQTNPAQNGIYIASAGAWSRASDANVIAEIRAALVSVWQGTTYGGSLWFTTMDQNDVLGTAPMNWYRVSHTGNIVDQLDALLGSDMWRSEGADGRTILSGTAAPTTEGEDGDFYLRTTTSMLYGPKATTWPAGVSLIGAQGPQGIQGETGPQGIQGETGADGLSAYEVAVAEGFVGSPAAWFASLTGPTGATGATGPQGIQGIQGIQGVPGEDGPPGADGADGATGPAGADGADGIDGATWTSGTGTPSGGADGDFYLDESTGNKWKKTAGTWSIVVHAPAVAYLVGFVPGTTVPSQLMAAVIFARNQRIPAGATDSQAKCQVISTGSPSFTILKNGTSIGSINFTSANNIGSFTFASAVDFAAGDIISIQGPASPDATFSDLSFNFKLLGIA